MPVIHIIMSRGMRGRLKNIRAVSIIFLIAAALAVTADLLYFSDLEWRVRTSLTDKRLSSLEACAEELLQKAGEEIIAGGDSHSLFRSAISRSALKKGITLLVYHEGRIAFWSDNSIAFPVIYEEHFDEHKPVFYSNGWFIPVHHTITGYELLALVKVYRQYPIVNNILNSGFPETFPLPREVNITFEEEESEFQTLGLEREFHFGLLFPEQKPNTIFLIVPVIMWLLVLFLVIRLIIVVSGWVSRKKGESLSIPLVFVMLTALYAIILLTGLPPSVKSTELFSPFSWSAGSFMPSIGHVVILGLLMVSGMRFYFRSERFKEPPVAEGAIRVMVPLTLFSLGVISFLLAEAFFRDVVLSSAISFEAFKILDMTFMSLAGLFAFMMLLTVPGMLFMRATFMIRGWKGVDTLKIVVAVTVVMVLMWLAGIHPFIWSNLWVVLLLTAFFLWQRRMLSEMTLSLLLSLLIAFFSMLLIIKYSEIKEEGNMEVMAISLAGDNDMVAEDMLIDMWPSLEADTVLAKLVKKVILNEGDINAVYRYLEEGYFYGYWVNYYINLVVCRDDSPLTIGSTGSEAENCFDWFDNRIAGDGDTITGTGFYFMNNESGRAWYLSKIVYPSSPGVTNGLFIELVSHIDTYLAGYPELLLDGSHQRFPRLKNISYAKYIDGLLVLRSGDYPYDTEIPESRDDSTEFRFVNQGHYRHLFYNRDRMTLALTADRVTVSDRIITFGYLFIAVLIYLFLLLVSLAHHPGELLKTGTLRRRLQLSFAAVLSVVFIIVITGAVIFSTRQFRNNHTRIISEKAASLSIELEDILGGEETLEKRWQTPEYITLNHLLVKYSNVFFTDINLYTPEGTLIATSRPEVFVRKLEGSLINPVAYGVLTSPGKEEYICTETIGDLEYLSVYLQFYNEDDQLLGYLNIPYFEMQNLLARETTNLIVTLVNFALLFLLVMMWVAVFLSERITRPLSLLQQAMASVAYGKKNEHIRYRSRDEVGELVKQYNRMTDELEESAGKLARTEREMAWREMARQIAHEIKNPLTPMKLNVQQLFKSWRDKTSDFDERISNFTGNQIEYIDNLSNIASAFSAFARLPAANPAEVDLLAQLKITMEMSGEPGDTSITLESGNLASVMVMADREHINSAFFNLLKNAIQAVSLSEERGEVTIVVQISGDRVQVHFTDNGPGIPEELIPKIFTPNFTTKSSGMGLGLSIVKRYIETAGGKIWFHTQQQAGTSFIIELPLLRFALRE